jgi:K+/H+ antiporter YhaU regulatory subunit KhtT
MTEIFNILKARTDEGLRGSLVAIVKKKDLILSPTQ